MAKQDVLDAINTTIVENGLKGITARTLRNILTMIVDNAGGSGGGDVFRVKVPTNLSESGEEFVFSPEYWAEMRAILESEVPGCSAVFNPVVENIFKYNAEAYQQLMEKGVKRESVMCLLDVSDFLEAELEALSPVMGFEFVTNALSYSVPAAVAILDGEPKEVVDEVTGGSGIVITPSVTDPLLGNYVKVQLFPDGSVGFGISSQALSTVDYIYVPHTPESTLTESQKTFNAAILNGNSMPNISKVHLMDGGYHYVYYPRVIYSSYDKIVFLDCENGRILKEALIQNDGSVVVTTLGTLNLTNE